MNELELAWAAGFFDGEGSVQLTRRGKPQWGIAQCDPAPLQRFLSAVGLPDKVHGPYGPNGVGRKPYYSVGSDRAGSAERIWAAIASYLCPPKAAQFERVFLAQAAGR